MIFRKKKIDKKNLILIIKTLLNSALYLVTYFDLFRILKKKCLFKT